MQVEDFDDVVRQLKEDDVLREEFMKACLRKLALNVVEEVKSTPKLSKIHLSSQNACEVQKVVDDLKEIVVQDPNGRWIKDQHDTFLVSGVETLSMDGLEQALPDNSDDDKFTDYNAITKHIVVHTDSHPAPNKTPYFNHDTYYTALKTYHAESTRTTDVSFGRNLLYGEVVTSTNTLLERYVFLSLIY